MIIVHRTSWVPVVSNTEPQRAVRRYLTGHFTVGEASVRSIQLHDLFAHWSHLRGAVRYCAHRETKRWYSVQQLMGRADV